MEAMSKTFQLPVDYNNNVRPSNKLMLDKMQPIKVIKKMAPRPASQIDENISLGDTLR